VGRRTVEAMEDGGETRGRFQVGNYPPYPPLPLVAGLPTVPCLRIRWAEHRWARRRSGGQWRAVVGNGGQWWAMGLGSGGKGLLLPSVHQLDPDQNQTNLHPAQSVFHGCWGTAVGGSVSVIQPTRSVECQGRRFGPCHGSIARAAQGPLTVALLACLRRGGRSPP